MSVMPVLSVLWLLTLIVSYLAGHRDRPTYTSIWQRGYAAGKQELSLTTSYCTNCGTPQRPNFVAPVSEVQGFQADMFPGPVIAQPLDADALIRDMQQTPRHD